jgi:hypothetical protein
MRNHFNTYIAQPVEMNMNQNNNYMYPSYAIVYDGLNKQIFKIISFILYIG